jgi:hypothetical protein
MDNDPYQEDDAPPDLIHAFRQLRPKDLRVPSSVDDAVLAAARRTLQPTRAWWTVSRWPNWARVSGLTAVGFAVALLMFLLLPARSLREDINGDKVVNILDAFQLARQLRSHGTLSSRFDFNGDGSVNQADVDVVAAEAVRLDRGQHL